MKRDYIKELKAGHEIVVVSGDKNTDSAIFFMENGKLYTFARSFGTIERTDRTLDEINEHLNNMADEYAQIFIRGLR